MNRFETQFDARHVLMAVLHPASAGEALAAARALHGIGVRAVFLTHRRMSENEVLAAVGELKADLPRLWVGVQLRDRLPGEALKTALAACGRRLDGLWTDAATLGDHAVIQAFEEAWRKHGWRGLHVSSVSQDALRQVPAERFDTTVRFTGVGCDVLLVAGAPSRLDELRAVRASLGSHATLGVHADATPVPAALRALAGAFFVEVPEADAAGLATVAAALQALAEAPPASSWFAGHAILAERADDARRLLTGDWRQDEAYPEPLWEATAPALARRVSIENGGGLYALLLVRDAADRRIEPLLAASGMGAARAYRVAVAESTNPVEDGFARRLVIWSPSHSAPQPVDALTLVREFIAAERQRIGDVEPWLREQYRNRDTSGKLFDWIDYPGFDSGTMYFGAAVMVHGAELHVWSRPVHAHK